MLLSCCPNVFLAAVSLFCLLPLRLIYLYAFLLHARGSPPTLPSLHVPLAGSYPGKPNPALLGSQLFASFMG